MSVLYPGTELFPQLIYCLRCNRLFGIEKLNSKNIIQCPNCSWNSIHSCWWCLHKDPSPLCYDSGIGMTCDRCVHRFFCYTTRCKIDWDYDTLKAKGWDSLPTSVQAESAKGFLVDKVNGSIEELLTKPTARKLYTFIR